MYVDEKTRQGYKEQMKRAKNKIEQTQKGLNLILQNLERKEKELLMSENEKQIEVNIITINDEFNAATTILSEAKIRKI